MAEEFSLIDMVDSLDLPLKNRIDKKGYYSPEEKGASCAVKVGDPGKTSLIPEEPLKEGEQYRFHFDMSKCIGCQCCVVACNEQNNNPADVNWRRVGEIEGGIYPDTKRLHLSMACNHCLDPSCLEGCPTDAYEKDEKTGIVRHKEEECIGCQYCTWNCPYGVPQYNPERSIVTKCDMCYGRLSENDVPACAASCPEEAISIEKVSVDEWRQNHGQADAPHMPESKITVSTTRITLPKDMPEEVARLNRHRVEPDQPHYSLIFMTVLTQLAAGGFLTLWLGDLLSHVFSFLKPLQTFLPFGAFGILAVTGLALSASLFHLGRPLFAYKALRMWKRSWLSREVLLFSLFSFFGAPYAGLLLISHYFGFHIPEIVRLIFGGGVAVLGMAGIFASAKIYMVPARPAWNTIRTPLRFYMTGFILGPLFSVFVYTLMTAILGPTSVSSEAVGFLVAGLSISAGAALVQLVVLLARLFHLMDREHPELSASTILLLKRFRPHFLSRIALLALGGFLLPFYLFHLLTQPEAIGLHVALIAASSFILSVLGEFLGRYIFFVTVVAKNMPGNFFTQNGGSH